MTTKTPAATASPRETPPRDCSLVRIVSADRATRELLSEWLGAAGYRVTSDDAPQAANDPDALAIVDVPFTRHGAVELLGEVSAQHPGVPILALSATFFSNVKCVGECARTLKVAGVLPKPVGRDALLAAVRGLLPTQ